MANVGSLDYEINVTTKGAEKAVKDFNTQLKESAKVADRALTKGQKFGAALGGSITAGFKSAGESAKQFLKALPGKAFDSLVRNFKRVALAAGGLTVALGTKAIKNAAEFETNLSNINTLLRVSQDEINAFGNDIQKLATTVPVPQSVLSEATYDIISAGISDTAGALDVLEQSAKLGVAGLGETGAAVDLVTSSLNSFNIPAEEAERVAGVLFNTVENGKTTVEELAVGFGRVAPSAASANVSFEELQAATAALTTTGLKANVAQTRLATAFDEVTKTGTDLDKAFVGIGFSSAAAAVEQEGFVGALETLRDTTGLTNTEIQNLFGSTQAGGAAFSLLTSQNEAFRTSLEGSAGSVESLNRAFEIQNATLANSFQLFKNVGQVILTDIGTAAFDPIKESLLGLNETFSSLVENPAFQRIQEGIGTALGEGIAFVIDRFSDFFGLLTENEGTVNSVIEAIKNIGSTIFDAFGIILDEVGPAFTELFEELGVTFAANEADGKSLAAIIAGVIGTGIRVLIETVTGLVEVFNENREAILNTAQLVGGVLKTAFEIIGPIIGGVAAGLEIFLAVIGQGLEALEQLAGLALGVLERLGFVADGTKEKFLSLGNTIEESSRIAGVSTERALEQTAQNLENVAIKASDTSEIFKSSLEEAGLSATNLAEDILSGAITEREALDIISLAAQESQEQLGATGEFLSEKFSETVQDFTSLNARLFEENEGLLSSAGATLEGLALVASDESEIFKQAIEEAGLSLDTLVVDLQSGSVNFEDAISIIGTALESSSDELGEFALVFDDKFTEVILRAEDAGLNIKDFSTDAIDSFESAGDNIATSSDGIQGALDGISETVEDTASVVSDSTQIAEGAIDELTDTSEAGANQIADSFVGTSETISNEVAQGFTDFGETGAQAVEQLASDTQAGTDQAVQASIELAEGTVEAVAGLPSDFEQIAAELVAGFTEGIRSRVSQAAAAAAEMANAATLAAKENLKIESPSKIFAELGGFTAEGFLVGIEEGTPAVLDSMQFLTDGLIEEGKEAEEAPLNFIRAFEELGKVVEDSMEEATDEIKDFVKNNQRAQGQIQNDLNKTNEAIQDLTTSFEEQNAAARAAFDESAIDIILDAEEERAKILEEINEIEKENTQTDAEKLKNQEKLLQLNSELAEQEEILNTASENQIATEEQLEEARRQAALNPLEALIEEFETEKTLREEQFNSDLLRLEEQKLALEESLAARQEEISNFFTAISQQDEAFTEAANAELQKREEATTASVGRLIQQFNRLAAARRAAGLGSGGPAPFEQGGLVPGFADGGPTPNVSTKKVTGVVHGGEYVMSNPMVKAFPNLVSALESVRPSVNAGQAVTNNNQRSVNQSVVVNSPLTLRAVLAQANQFLI